MTSPGEGSVSYRCPRCQAALTAHPGDAGGRQACPQCGKMVKVPGTPRAGTAQSKGGQEPGAVRQAPVVEQGIANIAIICPVCGTRMYATPKQVGQTMVCPDCLETVQIVAPAAADPKTSAARRPRTGRSVPPAQPRPARPARDDDAGEELKLSEPVDIPTERILPKQLVDLLRETDPVGRSPVEPAASPDDSAPGAAQPGGSARPGAGRVPAPQPSRPAPPTHNEFAVKCATCDTLVYATPEDIGQRRTCPDCGSPVVITAPRTKPRRVEHVSDADYEGQLFTLSEPAKLDVYQPSAPGTAARTMGEDALRKAEEAYDQRKGEEPTLPPIPLWDGLFRFLPHLPIFGRLVASSILLAMLAKLAMAVPVWADEIGSVQFLALLGTVGLLVLVVASFVYIGSAGLVVLQESAAGKDDIADWPTMSPAEMIQDSLTVAVPAFYALLPGLVLFIATGGLALPLATRLLFLGLSLYLFFPVIQLSALEAGSLIVPASPQILKSLSTDFLLWVTFYLMSFAVAMIVALSLTALRPDRSFFVILLLASVWSVAIFLFYRLLGRLAWASQERLLPKQDAKQRDADESPKDGH